MGLDATAYETAWHLPGHTYDEDTDYDAGIVQVFSYDSFPHALDGMAGQDKHFDYGGTASFIGGEFYQTAGRTARVHHSYGGYAAFRRALAQAAWGEDIDHWTDEMVTRHYSDPFFDLLWFADNEGTLGSQACGRLHQEFTEHRPRISVKLDEYHLTKYDEWAEMFEIAADTGLVDFH